MRSTVAWVVVVLLVFAGANLFWWQHYQIATYRAQLAEQDQALTGRSMRPSGYAHGSASSSVAWSPHSARSGLTRADLNPNDQHAEDRNLILDQYRETIAQLNLPPATASRLEDVLAERVQAVLDAEDAARREGYAAASAVAQQAVAMAIAQEDQRIVQLIGLAGERSLDAQGSAVQPAIQVLPPAPVIVNVMSAPAAAPDYSSAPVAAAADSGDYGAYSTYPYLYSYPYLYTPAVGYLNYGRSGRSYPSRRVSPARPVMHATSVSRASGRRR